MKRTVLHLVAAFALGALLWTFPTARTAAQQILEVRAKPGQTTMIGAFWPRDGQNETSNGMASGAFVDHGTVAFKVVRIKQTNLPATALFYTPNPGFTGVDKIDIPIGPRHLIYNVTVQ
jgi:hypothetical protein